MSADFVLTLTAPEEHGLDTFDTDASIWPSTDDEKISVSRYTGDSTRDSVMKAWGASWTLSNGITLGDELYLCDSPDGMGEGLYKDFAVTAGIRYSFSCLYKMDSGTLTIQLYDQTKDVSISSVDKTDAISIWKSYETSIIAPAGCNIIRVKFLQSESDVRPGPFYVDNISLSGNVLLHDPESYSRIPERIGSLHQTLVGRRIYDLRAIHYSFYLGWNVFEEDQYESLREIYYSNELLYFDDGDVPPLIESEVVYETAQCNYKGIANPSSTHKAYSDNSSSLPLSKSDFETTEFATAGYEAIDDDDNSYMETANPDLDEYLYHKFLFLSSTGRENVKRLRIKVTMSGSDSSSRSLDGGILYAWNGASWVELTRNTDSTTKELTYSTAESETAKQFVDFDDNYIRLLLRSRNRWDGTSDLSIRTYYAECEINEGLDLTIDLSHKAILDENDDVIWVKNLTKGTTLLNRHEYTISTDRRSVDIDAVYATIDGLSQYFNGGDMLDAGTNDISFSAWVKTISRRSYETIVFKGTYSGSQKYYGITIENGIPYFHYNDGTLSFYNARHTTNCDIADGDWHHVAATWNRDGNLTGYIDGYSVGFWSINGIDIDNTYDFRIGRAAGGQYLSGSVRDIRIYIAADAHWSASEILAQVTIPHNNSVNGINTSSWSFADSATATSIKDNTGSNDLTMIGGDTTNYGKHSRFESVSTGDKAAVKYNRYFEVMFASIPEEWFSGYSSSENRSRKSEVVLQTLSASM